MNGRIILFFLLTAFLALPSVRAEAQDELYFGIVPLEADAGRLSPLGTGENKFFETVVCLDTSSDVLVGKLEGCEIVGVRCFLNYEYRQKSKEFSAITVYEGDLESEPSLKFVNFEEGWNEVYLDQPIPINAGKTYVGMRVFELLGSPYPFAVYDEAGTVGSYFKNEGKSGWTHVENVAPLALQVIIKGDKDLLAGSASASFSSYPDVVVPGEEFACRIYVHNWSSEPLESLKVKSVSTSEEERTFDLSQPIAPYDGRTVEAVFRAGDEQGEEMPMSLTVSEVNGQPVSGLYSFTSLFYVCRNIFTRIPVIEEFTGLECVNCPFMSYYIDIALEEYAAPYVYIAHHAGYRDDELTTEADKALLYLFPESEATFNPAVMYDRRALESGEGDIIHGARLASPEPYYQAVTEAKGYPAEAMVLVDMSEENGVIECSAEVTVTDIAIEKGGDFRLSAFLIEDSITVEQYHQSGLDVEGAPDDLLERFRHNGVIRRCLSADPLGDVMTFDGENVFRIDYPTFEKEAVWNWDNCHVVAVAHKVNKEDLTDNYVLNAGDNRLNEVAKSVEMPRADAADDISVYVDGNRRLRTSEPVKSLRVYSLDGRLLQHDAALPEGIYVVVCVSLDGVPHPCKVAVR